MILQPFIPLWAIFVTVVTIVGLYIFTQRREINRSWRPSVLFLKRSAMLILLCMIASGVSVVTEIKSPGASNVDVLVLLDTTQSMAALDYEGATPRLSGAKKDLSKLANDLNGASFGIVTFDTQASTLLPFSSNQQTIQAAIESIQTELAATARGSNIDKPLEIAKSQLEARRSSNPERQLFIVYVGDGENTGTQKPKSFSDLKTFIDGGAVLGYGTAEGAKMIKNKGLQTDLSSTDYVKSYDTAAGSFQPATSKIDKQNLESIAEDLGVSFTVRSSANDAPVALAVESMKLEGDDKNIRVYQNLYFIFAVPLNLLLTYECLQLARQRRLITPRTTS